MRSALTDVGRADPLIGPLIATAAICFASGRPILAAFIHPGQEYIGENDHAGNEQRCRDTQPCELPKREYGNRCEHPTSRRGLAARQDAGSGLSPRVPCISTGTMVVSIAGSS